MRSLRVERGARNVNLELRPGDHVVLAGASGAGKCTLATPSPGSSPRRTGTWPSTARSPPTRAGATASASSPNTATTTCCSRRSRSTCSWAASGRREEDLVAAGELCVELGLGPALQCMPAGLGQTIGDTGWRLSQGERARVCLARALLADHDVLIFDEPLRALAPKPPNVVRSCGEGGCSASVLVYDLKRRDDVSAALAAPNDNADQNVTDIVLTKTGTVAWISEEHAAGMAAVTGRYVAYREPGKGVGIPATPVAAGIDITPGSLALAGRVLYWTQGTPKARHCCRSRGAHDRLVPEEVP